MRKVRDIGMSVVTSVNWFFNFMLAISFPPFWNSFHETGTFAYYAAWCLVGFVLILLFVPETKDQTLEELDARFSIPTCVHMKHSIKQLAWVGQYYVLRRRGLKRPKLNIKMHVPVSKEEMDKPRKKSIEQEMGRNGERLIAVSNARV